MTASELFVIECARRAHVKYWNATSNPGAGTKCATKVCKAWQQEVLGAPRSRSRGEFSDEVKVAGDTRQRIDLVESTSGVAYELKASKSNPHHEFYKDVFKVLAYNEALGTRPGRLRKLIFMVPEEGAVKLRMPLPESAGRFAESVGVKVDVVCVD